MHIALIGYGKMGQMIEKAALARKHSISAKLDSQKKISKDILNGSDICIDFSHPSCAVENIKKMAELGKNIVVGTTGWYDQIKEIKEIVEANQVGLIYSPNFSIGVNLFFEIVSAAAKLIDSFSEYDVGMIEAHHSQKVDSPSGTALLIAEQLINNIKRKKRVIEDLDGKAVPADSIHLSCLRCGSIPGTHSVVFDSAADSITLTHQARSREGFALGAVVAAEWLKGRKGVFTMNDLLDLYRN
jgi:4-hydroxy-tetrahydrodipicolinate reductase